MDRKSGRAVQRHGGKRRCIDQGSTGKPTPEQLASWGDFEAAAHKLRSRIGQHATDKDRRLLAKCLYHLDAKDRALDSILAISAKTWTDYLWAGKCLVGLKRWEDAISYLKKALEIHETASGYYWFAVAVSRDEWSLLLPDQQPLIKLLERAVSLSDCPPDAYLRLANLQGWDDEGENRMATLQKGIDAHQQSARLRLELADVSAYRKPALALSALRPLLERGIEPIETLWWWFQAAWKLGDLDDALRTIERLQREHEDKSKGSGLCHIKGELLLEMGRIDDAIACFSAELQKPDLEARTLALLGRARAHLAADNILSAIADATEAIATWNKCGPLDYFMPGCPSFVVIGGKDFDYLNEPGEGDVRAFGSQKDRRCRLISQCLSYLIGRESKDIELSVLQELRKSFDIVAIDKDLAYRYAEGGNLLWAIHHYLGFVGAEYDAAGWCSVAMFRHTGVPKANQEERLRAHAAIVQSILPRQKDAEFVEDIALQIYDDVWRDLLINGKLYAELLDVASFLCKSLPEGLQPIFDRAFALHQLQRLDEAEVAYRNVISRRPKSPGGLHNLSLILRRKGELDEAATLARRATDLAPDDEKIASYAGVLDRELKDRQLVAQRHEDFLQTARERWLQLDYHKKKILSALAVIKGGIKDLNHLAELTGTGEQYIRGNWRKLVELGMIVTDEDGNPCINKYIIDLVQQERSHAVVTTIIRADDRIAYKPIFNSRWEYTVYNVLIGLFPNHLVFPNMALQTIFQYDRMKRLLDGESFRYFLMSQVDFCITSTANYSPIVTFEVDSPYHDRAEQQERDRKKNDIFRCGGVPLLRLRAHGQPGEAAIRQEIVRVIQQFGQDLTATDRKSAGAVTMAMEIDFARFGLPNEPQKDTFRCE